MHVEFLATGDHNLTKLELECVRPTNIITERISSRIQGIKWRYYPGMLFKVWTPGKWEITDDSDVQVWKPSKWELTMDREGERLELEYKNGDAAGYAIPKSHVQFLLKTQHKLKLIKLTDNFCLKDKTSLHQKSEEIARLITHRIPTFLWRPNSETKWKTWRCNENLEDNSMYNS